MQTARQACMNMSRKSARTHTNRHTSKHNNAGKSNLEHLPYSKKYRTLWNRTPEAICWSVCKIITIIGARELVEMTLTHLSSAHYDGVRKQRTHKHTHAHDAAWSWYPTERVRLRCRSSSSSRRCRRVEIRCVNGVALYDETRVSAVYNLMFMCMAVVQVYVHTVVVHYRVSMA